MRHSLILLLLLYLLPTSSRAQWFLKSSRAELDVFLQKTQDSSSIIPLSKDVQLIALDMITHLTLWLLTKDTVRVCINASYLDLDWEVMNSNFNESFQVIKPDYWRTSYAEISIHQYDKKYLALYTSINYMFENSRFTDDERYQLLIMMVDVYNSGGVNVRKIIKLRKLEKTIAKLL